MIGKRILALTITGLMAFGIPAFATDYNVTTSMSITATPKAVQKKSVTPSAIDVEGVVVNPIKADGKTKIKMGELFSIVLEENASTGYAWTWKADAKAFQLMKDFNTIINTDKNIVGAPTNRVFTFKALKKGTFKIKLSYTRSWEKDNAPKKTAVYTVTIK